MKVIETSQMIRTLSFTKGEVIIEKGEQSSGIYYIKKGIARNEHSGIIYGENKKFKFFGILSFVHEGARTSTIKAETDVEALEIDPQILKSQNALHTLINDLLRETAEIIIADEKMIHERDQEVSSLYKRIEILEDELRDARK